LRSNRTGRAIEVIATDELRVSLGFDAWFAVTVEPSSCVKHTMDRHTRRFMETSSLADR
jgi:hypothetical protein